MFNPKEQICFDCKKFLCTDDVLEMSVDVKDFWGICRVNKKDVKGGDYCKLWDERDWVN